MEVVMEHTYLIVVGVDGSGPGQRALNWAVAEAARRARANQPTSVQAVASWQYDPLSEPQGAVLRLPDPRVTADRALAHAIADARADHPDIAVAGEVVEGKASDVLTRASAGADLLVLGSHGHSQIFHAVLGSVAEACVRNATCPVVVIPVARSASSSHADLAPAATAG
jgi:nucleotide-binding universal stress UspA family protein